MSKIKKRAIRGLKFRLSIITEAIDILERTGIKGEDIDQMYNRLEDEEMELSMEMEGLKEELLEAEACEECADLTGRCESHRPARGE